MAMVSVRPGHETEHRELKVGINSRGTSRTHIERHAVHSIDCYVACHSAKLRE